MNTRPAFNTLTGVEAYAELTEYLSADDLALIEKGIAALPATLEADAVLAKRILKGDWEKLFNKDNANRNHFPSQAMRCLRAGLIDTMTFCTSQMFFNVMTHPEHANQPVRVEPLFNPQNGKISANSRKMIDATMRLYSSSHRAYLEQENLKTKKMAAMGGIAAMLLLVASPPTNTSAWDDEKNKTLSEWDAESEKRFYEILKTLPKSEQQFLLIPDPTYDGNEFSNEQTVIRKINFDIGFNAFSRLRVSGVPMCMIPSRGMMQAFLLATRGENTRFPAYRLSLSSEIGLFNTAKSLRRDMFQQYAPLTHLVPELVDGYPAPTKAADAEKHDFYHQKTASDIPLNDHNLLIMMGEFFFTLADSESDCRKLAAANASEVGDMEYGSYNPCRLKKNPSLISTYTTDFYKFWRSLHINGRLTQSIESDEAIKLADHFISFILAHETELEEKFGLKLITLLNFKDTKDEEDNSWVVVAREKLREMMLSQIKSQSILQLLALSNTTTCNLLRDMIKDNIVKMVEKSALDQLVLDAYKCQCDDFLRLVVNKICSNFKTFYASGALTSLQKSQPQAFEFVMSAVKASPASEELLIDAIQSYDDRPQMFEMLYDPRFPNRGNALYYAAAAKNMELMLQLTNDGATVTKLPESKKVSPFEKAAELECKDLQALLVIAEQSGAGWVDKSPTVIARLRRLAAFRVSKDKDIDEKLERDLEWMHEVVRKAPAGFKRVADTQNQNLLFARDIDRDELLATANIAYKRMSELFK